MHWRQFGCDQVGAAGIGGALTGRTTPAVVRLSWRPDSLRLTELAAARHRNHELTTKVQALERRLSAQGPTPGPALMEQHPVVVELHERIAELQIAADDKARTIATLCEDIEILRETNRSLVREYGLLKP